MEFPSGMPSNHDKLDKNRSWVRAFLAIYYIKDLLSHFKEVSAGNARQVCPEPCFHFSATTFVPPDLQKRSISDFDSLKIIEALGENKVDHDSDSDLGVIMDLELSPEKDRKLDEQLNVVEILANLVKEKNVVQLVQLGGVEGLASSLCTNMRYGIQDNPEEVSNRQEIFGSNKYRRPPTKSLFSLFLGRFLSGPILLILLACGALSVGAGMKTDGLKEGWYDGVSIVMVMLIVISLPIIRDFWKFSQLDKLALKCSESIQVDVVRNGERKKLSVFEIVVGDVVCLKIGDQVPADGLFLDGQSLLVDESSMTGQSDLVEVNITRNPFLISGTKVSDGYGTMLVTSVGMKTMWGEMMSTIRRGTKEETPLHVKHNNLATLIGLAGLSVSLSVLVILIAHYFRGHTHNANGTKEYIPSLTKYDATISTVFRIILLAVTITGVAVPDGIPLAVALTLALSTRRMMADQAMVRKLSACETMGSATTICTQTGILTTKKMRVTKFWLGLDSIDKGSRTSIAANILSLLHQAVALNTTGSVYKPISDSIYKFSGSPTEKAILSWAVHDLQMYTEGVKECFTLVHVEPFKSDKKRSGVLMKKNVDNTFHVHWKGAAQPILNMCSHYYNHSGEIKSLDDSERKIFEQLIQDTASSSLRCIAFAYKEVTKKIGKQKEADQKIEDSDLVLLGLIGIENPCRPGVKKAVEDFHRAGVSVKMITGDDLFTAQAIAAECGILKHGGAVEGVEFRNYTRTERMQNVDKICVMASSSPSDKLLMVQCLQEKGHVVAVTGYDTNDAPTLKEANIGISMAIQGTEVAKESSDIVILDDNLSSIATSIKWGRCVYNNTQILVQFQLTFIVAVHVISFMASVIFGEVPLTVIQLLWGYIIMEVGGLALVTEWPSAELMQRVPIGRREPVVTNVMWRNMILQALYQTATILTLQFKGEEIFKVNKKVRNTLIFNTFVLCQVFNLVNARKLEKKNIFIGLHRNKLFVGIIGFVLVLQVVMVELLNKFAHTQKLNWEQWGVCISLASVSWPLGFAVKFIPVPRNPFFIVVRRKPWNPYM